MRFSKLISYGRIFQRTLKCDRITIRSCSCTANVETKDEKPLEPSNVDGGKKGLVLGIYETKNEYCLTPAAAEVDQKSGGKICKYLNELSSEMKLGRAFVVTDLLPEYSAVALSLLGPKEAAYNELESLDEARENIRWMVGAGVRQLMKRGCGVIDVDPVTAPDAAAEAAELTAWRFDIFKGVQDRRAACVVQPLGGAGAGAGGEAGAGAGAGASWARGAVLGGAQNWARYLSDMPANKMTPVDLAQAAIDMLCPLGVTVQAHDREWITAQRMRAFLAVARGSCREPMFLELKYQGAGGNAPAVLIAAKGVTFDSGGLCLKKCESMTENRGSMAGAAVALAAIKAIAKLKIPINVCAVIPLCENMVSGQCMKVGDVVTALNGLSIQIEHTDYEGRLMMADALVYGQHIHHPSLVIDVATFTRGVLMATGGGAFGCFSNCERAWAAVRRAGALSGDRPWRFPLWGYYRDQLTNDPSVDLRNKGSGHAAPCLGAAFLKNFICGSWVHMDITGVGKLGSHTAPPYLHARRMTGRPARALAALLADIAAHSHDQAVGCAQHQL